MDLFSPKHLLLVLMIVLLVFGGKKLKTLGSDLGSAFRGFKRSVADGESEEPTRLVQNAAAAPLATGGTDSSSQP
jgi:sec-independent protein translocase protein TatA